MIRHSVVFTLKHPAGSLAETEFLAAAEVLARIPGVQHFERLRQVSAKTDFAFMFTMQFADEAAYAAYNEHPDHVAFVRDRWLPEVERFMEIDTVAL